MINRKIGTYIGAILAGIAVISAGPQLTAAFETWESAPDMVAMNPTTTNAHTARYEKTVGQFDRNADGKVDLIITDRNGDGRADYWATDRNFDGRFDDYQYDRNFNGSIDQWEYDLDGDGVSDKIYVDADGDGKAELYAILNPLNKTYTWYGNMSLTANAASNANSFPSMDTVYLNTYRGGRATDSK